MNVKRIAAYTATALLSLGVGYGVADGAPDVQEKVVEVSVPGPERVVEVPGSEKVVEVSIPGPERVVEHRVEVPIVPQVCLEALDLADQGFGHSAAAMSHAQDGFIAISEYDSKGLEEATRGMESSADKLNALAPRYNAAKAACRAGEAA